MKKKKIKSKKLKKDFSKKVAIEFYLTTGQKMSLTAKAKKMGISRSTLIKSVLEGLHFI